MTFCRKIFISVFASLFLLGSLLIWGAHHYFQTTAEEEFASRYSVFSRTLSGTLTRLDASTEALMVNAAKVVAEKDAAHGLLATDELRALQRDLSVTHVFIVGKDGKFLRSTNEDPAVIPNLFSYCPSYSGLVAGRSAIEATPVVKPQPEPKPFKFVMIPNHDRSRIIEVGIRVDFIARTLAEAVGADRNVVSMSLYAPDGTHFGTYSDEHVSFSSKNAQLPENFERPIEAADGFHFYTKVLSSHPNCCQCEVAGTSKAGEYYYVLESVVSTAELRAAQSHVSLIFLFVGIANALLSFVLARILSRRLVRNFEIAVARVRSLKSVTGMDSRIELAAGDEVSFLTQEFDRLLDSLQDSQGKLLDAQRVHSKVELARTIAHNMNSPVLALEMTLPALRDVPERMKRVLQNSVKEIRELANRLRTQSDGMISRNETETDTDVVFLPIFIADVINQKRAEFSANPDVSIFFHQNVSDGPLVKVSALELRGVLSNLINNAVEAYGSAGGCVNVDLASSDYDTLITVSDKGIGIPDALLSELGTKSISIKQGRSRGLGLMHAFRAARAWGGGIDIVSAIACGTSVTIRIPNYVDEQNRPSNDRNCPPEPRSAGIGMLL